MPKLVIRLDTSRATGYCVACKDWLLSFPRCKSCQNKDEAATFRYVREQDAASSEEEAHSPGSAYPRQPPPYSTIVSNADIEEQEINFELATPQTLWSQQQAAEVTADLQTNVQPVIIQQQPVGSLFRQQSHPLSLVISASVNSPGIDQTSPSSSSLSPPVQMQHQWTPQSPRSIQSGSSSHIQQQWSPQSLTAATGQTQQWSQQSATTQSSHSADSPNFLLPSGHLLSPQQVILSTQADQTRSQQQQQQDAINQQRQLLLNAQQLLLQQQQQDSNGDQHDQATHQPSPELGSNDNDAENNNPNGDTNSGDNSGNRETLKETLQKEEREIIEAISKIQESEILIHRSDIQLEDTLGRGWFGPVARGSACVRRRRNFPPEISQPLEEIPVVVQLLREGASQSERDKFDDQQRGARLAGGINPHVLQLLASLVESDPHINVLEECGLGCLKSFLREREKKIHFLHNEGLLLKFCKEITSGLAAMFQIGFVPTDLGTRTCQITSTMTVKVGDYGLAPVWFLEDYVPVNGEGQPVRWIPPEILGVLDRTGEEDNSDSLEESDSSDSEDGAGDDHEKYLKPTEFPWTKQNSLWSLAVTLWEVTTCACDRPFDSISDNSFVSTAIEQPLTLTTALGPMRIKGVDAEAVQSVIDQCLRIDPSSRPDCSRFESYLTDILECKLEEKRKK